MGAVVEMRATEKADDRGGMQRYISPQAPRKQRGRSGFETPQRLRSSVVQSLYSCFYSPMHKALSLLLGLRVGCLSVSMLGLARAIAEANAQR